jgi:preprotein translocase subunit SecG
MHSTVLETFLEVVHIFVCGFLMLVVLLQQGKGGGMGAAFGGGAAQQVFGGRGAGNLLTRTTGICAGIFMVTSVLLAYLSSSGDRALKAKAEQVAAHQTTKGHEGKPRSSAAETLSGAAPTPPTPPSPEPSGSSGAGQ